MQLHFFPWHANGSVHSSEWLTSGRKTKAWWQKRREMDTEWIWHDECQCPHWSAAFTSLPEPWKVGLESAGSWRSQLTVTALSNHITHHAVWEAARLPRMMDRWQSSPLYCSTQSPHLSDCACFGYFVPIPVFAKCQTILRVKVSSFNILWIQTFTRLMMINDCILFSSIPNFHFLALHLQWAADL